MILKRQVITPSKVKEVEYHLASCIKCGHDIINVEEYEDTFGYISTAKCLKCNNKVKTSGDYDSVVKKWNSLNDLDILIKTKLNELNTLKNEINDLIQQRKSEGYKINIDDVKSIILKIPHSESRMPYTYHHDYLRNQKTKFNGMSRSDIASMHDSNEIELYSVALVYLLNTELQITIDQINNFTPYDYFIVMEVQEIVENVLERYKQN